MLHKKNAAAPTVEAEGGGGNDDGDTGLSRLKYTLFLWMLNVDLKEEIDIIQIIAAYPEPMRPVLITVLFMLNVSLPENDCCFLLSSKQKLQ